MATFYEVLGVAPEADAAAIRSAYRALIRQHHPDANGGAGEGRAREINEAYHTLSDPGRRARYDLTLAHRPRAGFRAPNPPRASPPLRPDPVRARQRTPPAPDSADADDPWRRGGLSPRALWSVAAFAVVVLVVAILGLRALLAHPTLPSSARAEPTAAARPAPSTPPPAHARAPRRNPGALDADERASLEGICLHAGVVYGEQGYRRCRARQLRLLAESGPRPDLSGLDNDERAAVEAGCLRQKWYEGPGAYDRCRSDKLALLTAAVSAPALAKVSRRERPLVASYCLADPAAADPAAFTSCLAHRASAIRAGRG